RTAVRAYLYYIGNVPALKDGRPALRVSVRFQVFITNGGAFRFASLPMWIRGRKMWRKNVTNPAAGPETGRRRFPPLTNVPRTPRLQSNGLHGRGPGRRRSDETVDAAGQNACP